MAYIDKAKAIQSLTDFKENHLSYPKACLMMIDICITLIKIIPIADVVEVKHGEWIEQVRWIREDRTVMHYQCSLCGVYLADKVNYCPNCGADMRGVKNENE